MVQASQQQSFTQETIGVRATAQGEIKCACLARPGRQFIRLLRKDRVEFRSDTLGQWLVCARLFDGDGNIQCAVRGEEDLSHAAASYSGFDNILTLVQRFPDEAFLNGCRLFLLCSLRTLCPFCSPHSLVSWHSASSLST